MVSGGGAQPIARLWLRCRHLGPSTTVVRPGKDQQDEGRRPGTSTGAGQNKGEPAPGTPDQKDPSKESGQNPGSLRVHKIDSL